MDVPEANIVKEENFVYMDMSVYNEEDEISSEIDVKEEVGNTDPEDDKTHFPLNSLKNVENSLSDKNSKRSHSRSSQKENVEEKRYRLRNRKNISMKEDDYFYDMEKKKKKSSFKKRTKLFCERCGEIFNDNLSLKEHILSHKDVGGLKNLTCDICKEIFSSKYLIRKHMSTHFNSCRECEEPVENIHHHNCKFSCDLCNKKFSQLVKLKIHLLDHQGISYKCVNCKKSFELVEKLDKHDCKNKKKYECDVCSSKFVRLVKLQIHILNVHHGINYQCDKCLVKFPSKEEMDGHVCKNEEPSVCNICGKIFAKRDYLKKHQYMHSNVLFKCKYCYCAFMKEKSYNRHIERMNCSKSARKIRLAEFNYKKCRLCEVEFDSEEVLIAHFAESHPTDNPHQCFCCESCLPNSKEFQNHIHQHNIQKYTCNICGKPYTSQEGFRKHRLKHKGAEFKCKFCEAEFLNESRFKFHVRTCKKNPDSGYDVSKEDKPKTKKDEKPKQSRQLHWESRIIMKHLRGDPQAVIQSDSSVQNTFFDEPESDSKTSERGWFDNYYKTEEDDIAFGLKKEEEEDSDFDVTEFLQTGSIVKKKKTPTPPPMEEDNQDAEEEDSDSSSDSSEEEVEDQEPIDYNPKKCRICVVLFGQEYELLHHFIKVHPGMCAHKCPDCDFECPLFAQLKEHMKTHGIGMGVFNCDNCSKKFKSEKKMKSHNVRCKGMDAEIEPQDEDYCKKCCKKFQTKCGYRRHKQSCKGKRKPKKTIKPAPQSDSDTEMNDPLPPPPVSAPAPPPPPSPPLPVAAPPSPKPKEPFVRDIGEPPMDSFPCRLCDKKFQYERGIVMHFKSDHPGHKALICHVCNMHLADKLKEHLKTHGIGEEFICELCGKRFNQKFLSKIHEMWHQGIEYKCSNCKQKFLNKEKMDKHIGENRCSNRQSLMRLPCSICGKSYRSKFGLSKHYITHTPKELRPVKNRMNCEYCGKWFENNNGLQRHRRIHTGERPFCCRFCPKAFAQEGNCKAHERIHTGESKPRKKKQQPVEVQIQPYPTQLNFYLCNNFDPNTIVTN